MGSVLVDAQRPARGVVQAPTFGHGIPVPVGDTFGEPLALPVLKFGQRMRGHGGMSEAHFVGDVARSDRVAGRIVCVVDDDSVVRGDVGEFARAQPAVFDAPVDDERIDDQQAVPGRLCDAMAGRLGAEHGEVITGVEDNEAHPAIDEVVHQGDQLRDRGVGLVVFNASYDLTMLRAEASRHGIAQPAWDRLLVVDPLVIDWGIEHGRLGPRKLTDVSAYYRVVIDNAHDATCDAVAARDVAYEMGFRHATVAAHSLAELQDRQREWFAERVADWNRYAVTKGWSLDDPTGWPLGINQD